MSPVKRSQTASALCCTHRCAAKRKASQPRRNKPGGNLSGNRSHQGTKSLSSGSAAHIGVRPEQIQASHEPLRAENDLEWIFTKKFNRKLSKDLQFQYDRDIYQIQTKRPAYALKGREVKVLENEHVKIKVLLNQTPLEFKRFIR